VGAIVFYLSTQPVFRTKLLRFTRLLRLLVFVFL
jgi:hypothetical protein